MCKCFEVGDDWIGGDRIQNRRRFNHLTLSVKIIFRLSQDTLLLGEAKWKSSVGSAQGKNKDKDQIQLRIEFLQKYAPKLYPEVKQFVVLGVGLKNDVTENYSDQSVKCIGITWGDICSLESHPNHDELLRYLAWKIEYTKKG